MVDVSKETKISLLLSVKRSQYQYIIWESTNEPILTLQLLENHVGYGKVTFTINPEIFARTLFSRIALKRHICDVKICD